MDNQDKSAFYKALKTMIQATTGTYSPPDDLCRVYWETLKGFPASKVIKTLEHLTATEEGHQAPAKVARLVSGKKKETGSAVDFSNLCSLIDQHGIDGARDRIDKDSKAWKTIIKLGGLRGLNTGDRGHIRSAFLQAYDQ